MPCLGDLRFVDHSMPHVFLNETIRRWINDGNVICIRKQWRHAWTQTI